MMADKSKFQINQVLPLEMIIEGADSHLYKQGLSLFESMTKIKRKWYSSPILVTLFMIINLVSNMTPFIIDLGVGADNHLIFADSDYFIQSMGVSNYLLSICALIILCSQLINVYNKWNGIKPDLRLFEMMAGFTSPQSIGLKDKESTLKLIKYTNVSLKTVRVYRITQTINTFFLCFLLLCLRPVSMNLLMSTLIRLSWSLFWAIWIYHFISILFYQFTYFLILCYYLHLKLSQINRRIANKEKNIYQIIGELTNVYQEISRYNSNYWSKFLLLIYSAMSSLIAMVTFVSIVIGIPNRFIEAIFFSYALFNTLFLLLTIRFSSLIYNDCKHTYCLLNSYANSVKILHWRNKIKVNHNRITRDEPRYKASEYF